MEKLFVIIDKETKRVLGFTRWKDYTTEHPEVELVEITEDHEIWLSENPQAYVFDPDGKFILLDEENVRA